MGNDVVLELFVGFFFAFLPGLMSQGLACRQGRSAWHGWLLGLCLGWIGYIILVMIGPLNRPGSARDARRSCPECGESIPRIARKCRFCAAAVTPAPVTLRNTRTMPPKRSMGQGEWIICAIAITAALVGVVFFAMSRQGKIPKMSADQRGE